MRDILKICVATISIMLSVTAVAGENLRLEPITPIPDVTGLDLGKVALGKRLFHDPGLSSDGSVSCASCHNLKNSGVDNQALSSGVRGQLGTRNTPTVLNSGLLFRLFWDGRAATLEQQAMEVLTSPVEMDNDWDTILDYLKSTGSYQDSFTKIYGDEIVTKDKVSNALAEFQRSLLTPNGAFDRYLKGDDDAIDEQTLRGYQRFKSYGCISCHQGVAVGGNMYEKLGVIIPFKQHTPDLGRYQLTGLEEDKYKFKVPSLRNVARTSPYFHDGSISTLEGAVTLMAKHQLGRNLSEQETDDIVKFLQSLNGSVDEE